MEVSFFTAGWERGNKRRKKLCIFGHHSHDRQTQIFMYKQQRLEPQRNTFEGAERFVAEHPFKFGAHDRSFLWCRTIMTFHISTPTFPHTLRARLQQNDEKRRIKRKGKKTFPKITVRKWNSQKSFAGWELCIRIHVYRMYILSVKGKNGDENFLFPSFLPSSVDNLPPLTLLPALGVASRGLFSATMAY